MTEVTPITSHIDDALKRRIAQWICDKPNMEKLIRSMLVGHQEIEDVAIDLRDKRLDIYAAEGVQLDQFGTIVGQDRLGLNDELYRILLLVKIGINVSDGEPERIINIMSLLSQGGCIHYMNLFAHEIAIGTNGTINPLTTTFLLTQTQRAVAASVRINYLTTYCPDEAFAFSGVNIDKPAKGFGDDGDPGVGGKFATMHTLLNPFSFAGNNVSDDGFGTIADPLVGGGFETL